MKFRNTLLMLIVFVVLGGYVYYMEKKGEEEKKSKEISQKLFNFVKDSVETMEVTNSYGHFLFQKVQGEWRIMEPLSTEADESIINSVLTNLKDAKIDREFKVAPEELPDFGLDEKAIKVRLKLTDGTQDSLKFGDKTPVGTYVFVAKTDTVVYTTNQYIQSSLKKKLHDWREKRLLRFKRDKVNKIVVRNPYGTYEFEKQGGMDWTFLNIKRPADSGKLSGILSKLQYNRAKAFVDEEGKKLRKFGLKRPRYRIDLFLGTEKARKTLFISRKIKNKYYARDDSRKPIIEIDSALVKDINKPLLDFRGRDFAKVDRDKVDRIVIQYADTLLACVKDSADSNWHLDETNRPVVKKAKMLSLMSDLDYASIKEFVADDQYTLSRYGLEAPRLKVQLYHGKELLLEALFGKPKGDRVYAMTNQYNSVYLIEESKFKELKLKRDDILEAPPPQADTTVASSN